MGVKIDAFDHLQKASERLALQFRFERRNMRARSEIDYQSRGVARTQQLKHGDAKNHARSAADTADRRPFHYDMRPERSRRTCEHPASCPQDSDRLPRRKRFDQSSDRRIAIAQRAAAEQQHRDARIVFLHWRQIGGSQIRAVSQLEV
ncbi:MAG TPA: hypothetical protein VGP71_17125 [Burkholderiales bacterium]|nr:hypothetical protein [Burkholderiales bacterium]